MKDRFALLITTLFLLLIYLPYALAVAWAPPAHEFLWSFYVPHDTSVYLSAMRSGARGEWLRALPYTTEPHAPALYYIFYVFIGHLLPPSFFTFNVLQCLSALMLSISIWQLCQVFLPSPIERRIAYTLALLGLGVGFLTLLLGLWPLIRPTDIFMPNASLLGASWLAPHISLAAAFQCQIIRQYLRALQAPYPNGALFWGALLCLCMSWLLPYQLVILVVIMGTDVILTNLRTFRQTRHRLSLIWTPAARAALFIALPSSSMIFYYWMLQNFMPFWSELINQWPVLENLFDPWDFAAGYAWILVFALLGAWRLWRQPMRTHAEQFLSAWFIANALLILSPLDFADRTSLGFTIPLGLLAAIGLIRVIVNWTWLRQLRARYAPKLTREALPFITFVSVLPAALLLCLFLALDVRNRGQLPYYLHQDARTAIDWLAHHTSPKDVVLASPNIANLVPALTDARVFAGHLHETYQAPLKRAALIRFYDASTSHAERQALLQRYAITYVYAQPNADGVGTFDASNASYLQPVFRVNDITLYQVKLTD